MRPRRCLSMQASDEWLVPGGPRSLSGTPSVFNSNRGRVQIAGQSPIGGILSSITNSKRGRGVRLTFAHRRHTQKEPRSVLYSLSNDDGLTWSAPKPFPRDAKVRSIIRHPIVELSPGQWLVSLSDKTFIFDPETESSKPLGDGLRSLKLMFQTIR